MANASYSVLKKQIEKEILKLQKQARALQTRRRGPVITEIIRSMREYEITPEDIATEFAKRATPAAAKTADDGPKRTVSPKYRHPKTQETWTGRGKAPRWLTAAEAEGRSREEFLIKE